MRRKGYTRTEFGPAIPIVKNSDFDLMRLERDEFERAWEIVGPSATRNMGRVRASQLWKVITAAYLEGLAHGYALSQEKAQ